MVRGGTLSAWRRRGCDGGSVQNPARASVTTGVLNANLDCLHGVLKAVESSGPSAPIFLIPH
eukprot:5829510-Amphidinium_carterae.1